MIARIGGSSSGKKEIGKLGLSLKIARRDLDCSCKFVVSTLECTLFQETEREFVVRRLELRIDLKRVLKLDCRFGILPFVGVGLAFIEIFLFPHLRISRAAPERTSQDGDERAHK